MRELLAFIALLFAVCAFFLAFACAIDYLDCRGFSGATGIETSWRWGCYAKVGDRWVPKDFVFGKANELRIKTP